MKDDKPIHPGAVKAAKEVLSLAKRNSESMDRAKEYGIPLLPTSIEESMFEIAVIVADKCRLAERDEVIRSALHTLSNLTRYMTSPDGRILQAKARELLGESTS